MIPFEIVHNDYTKIVANVFRLDYKTILRFTVNLSFESQMYGVQNFHKEYCVINPKTNDRKHSVSLDFPYCLSLENTIKDSNGIKEYIRITANDMIPLLMMLEQGLEWFTNPKYANLYANKDGRLVLMESVIPRRILCGTKYVEIEPMVYVYPEGNYGFGVRLYLNSEINYAEMDFNTFCGLIYHIRKFDMYNSALLLINYMGRPSNGTNMITFDNGSSIDMTHYREETTPIQKTGRKPNIFNNRKPTLDDL